MSQKAEQQKFQIVHFGHLINLIYQPLKQKLWSRGFIDKNLYLSSLQSNESLFTIQPKKGLLGTHSKYTLPVIFQSEILIKHTLSGHYLSVKEVNQMPTLQFSQEQNSSCYFELISLRTFEGKGDCVTTDSLFVIQNTDRKLYISIEHEQDEQIEETMSPKFSPKFTGKKLSRQKGQLGFLRETKKVPSSQNSKNSQMIQTDLQKSSFFQKIKKKKTLICDQVLSDDGEPQMQRVISEQKNSQKVQQMAQSILKKNTSLPGTKILRSLAETDLILYRPQANIKKCSLQNYPSFQWKIKIINTSLQTPYFENYQFIYLTHSQQNKVLTIDVEKKPFEQTFQKSPTSGYLSSSIFVVQIEDDYTMYLRHYLTGRYFPLNEHPSRKKKFELIPLLPSKKKKVPPFKILFEGQQFIPPECQKVKDFHGFWLNKVSKKQLAEIISFQNVPKQISLNYFIKFLKRNTIVGQKLLRQCQFIPYIIQKLIPTSSNDRNLVELCYKLLFYICKNNPQNKKKCILYIQKIIKQQQKHLILDLLTQLLGDYTANILFEKAITRSIIESQAAQFINNGLYSVPLMRIFRVFCGPQQQPCSANQKKIFNMFFLGDKVEEEQSMLQSGIFSQKQIQIPQFYKFNITESQNQIYISNSKQTQKYQIWQRQPQIINYIRQYFYLLSDCLNNTKYSINKAFTSHMSRNLLLKLLHKTQMRGPCLSLLVNAYLKPQRRYKPHIFHKDYEKICENGKMISMNSQSQGQQLKQFIVRQLKENHDYRSTSFRILLNAFKLTIDNGYWGSHNQLLEVAEYLKGIITQPESISDYHDTYEQKVQQKNLMRSKTVAISIKITLIQIQICLWVSDFISGYYTEQQIENKILVLTKNNKQLMINQQIFTLCSTNSPQLMRKSLLLMYKTYNIQKLFYKSYSQACIQTQSSLSLNNIFSILNHKKTDLTIQNYFELIKACISDVNINNLSPSQIRQNYLSLEPLFKYKKVNQEVQNMMYKLGVLQKLIKDIQSHSKRKNKERREKTDQYQRLYWKLLLLYAIIKNNLKLRDIVSQYRKQILNFIETEDISYYVAADIIEQLYRNNRKLIINDTKQLEKICKQAVKAAYRKQIDLKCCKLANLLSVFIESGNRKIMQNHQIILKIVFTKPIINQINRHLDIKQNSDISDDEYQLIKSKYRHTLQIVIYDLLGTMGQKKLLLNFNKPNTKTIKSLLLSIGSSNWSLKSKALSCIDFSQKMSSNSPIQFLNLILYDLNVICQSLHFSLQSQFKQFSKQVKIYVSNLRKIISTISSIFKYISQNNSTKLQNLYSDEVLQIIKTVQRLYIMKSMCPLVVRKDIQNLLKYIEYIQMKIKKNNYQDNLIEAIQIIQLQDFSKKELKDKLPLIFTNKVKNKKNKGNRSLYQESKIHVENQIQKKNNWAKKCKANVSNLVKKDVEKEMVQLENFLTCLKNVNQNDSKVLEVNIKQFVVNFIKTSYLQGDSDQRSKMQDILVKYQIHSIICLLLQQPFKQHYKLFQSTFQLAIGLLEGGHSQCQKKFLTHFYQNSKNQIFINIYTIINDSLKTIQFYYKYEEDPTIKSYQMMLEFQQVYICKEQRKLSCRLLEHAFRFLQLLCENDHQQMKAYIYNQTDADGQIKYMSKNFIQVACTALERVFDILSYSIEVIGKYPDSKFKKQLQENIFTLPNFILDFLIQVCQIPAINNQLYLCRTDFFDFIRNLMALRKKCKNDTEDIFIENSKIFFQIQRKIIVLLRSLLEQDSEQIIQLMTQKLSQSQLQFFVEESCAHGGLQDTEKLNQIFAKYDQINPFVQNIVDVLIVKRILKFTWQFNFGPEKLSIIDALTDKIDTINVNFQGHSMTVYFHSHSVFLLLRKKTKLYLLDRSAKLNTRKQKLTDFMLSRQMIYQDIQQEKDDENRLLTEKKMRYLFNFALFLSYLIIGLLILFYSVGKSGVVLDIYETQIISSLAYMQLVLALLYTIFLGYNQKQAVKKKLKTKQHSFDMTQHKSILVINPIQVSNRKLIYQIYFEETDSLHAVFLMAISLYACFFERRVYAFCLLFIFVKIQFLESIFKAIKLTWQQLIFVCLFALAFSLIFGFLTIDNYIGPLYQNQDIDIDINKINEHCNTIFTCVSSLYTQKIIGESVTRQQQQYNYRRFISDIIYQAFFNIFLTNIIAAIIIDKFAEQRNVKQKVEHDRYSSCYVCFADKSTLQRRGQDYNSHVTHVHNLWNYFYYMYTLQKLKDITEYTGIEYWINNQIKSNMIDWIPIDDSLKEQQQISNAQEQKQKSISYSQIIEEQNK